MQGATAVFSDDLESFTDARRARWTRRRKGGPELSARDRHATNARDPAMKVLEPLAKVRLFAPRTHEIVGESSDALPGVYAMIRASRRAICAAPPRLRVAQGRGRPLGRTRRRLPEHVCRHRTPAHAADGARGVGGARRGARRGVGRKSTCVHATDARANAAELFACVDVCRTTRYETHDAYVPRLPGRAHRAPLHLRRGRRHARAAARLRSGGHHRGTCRRSFTHQTPDIFITRVKDKGRKRYGLSSRDDALFRGLPKTKKEIMKRCRVDKELFGKRVCTQSTEWHLQGFHQRGCPGTGRA